MAKFFQPVRMESMYLDSSLKTAFLRHDGVHYPVEDGSIVVLTDEFFADPVYSKAAERAGVLPNSVIDFNAHYVQYPASTTAENVWIVDIADVPTATNEREVYRIGARTIGLVREAGKPVRIRRNALNDTFIVGAQNFNYLPTVGEYAGVSVDSGLFTSLATPPAEGAYWKVSEAVSVSEGLEPVAGYRLTTLRS